MYNDNNELTKLTFHHVGLAVENMAAAVAHYSDLFGKENISDIINVSTQKVNVCFVKNADESYIELVASTADDSVIHKLLKRSVTYYHLGYKVADIEAAVIKLEQINYKAMEFFNSEAFHGKRCIFLFSPEAHLIELIEK